ncbi:MAG: family 1 glycosylhydrolase [Chitinophagales bacterium]|nr:family 1 glycosylhydrolase [Chitinophagales bacterium]
MKLQFKKDFVWGTSTAAYQIETVSDNEWKGLVSIDGTVFDKCSMHDLRRDEDVEHIARLGTAYRMSCDWGKLQKYPYAEFDAKVAKEYLDFLEKLKAKDVKVMMVLHHFTNPIWFAEAGSWEKKGNRQMWLDFVKKSVDTFGHLVDLWNTFNEPMVYISNGWLLGSFPPFKKGRLLLSRRVLKEIGRAHDEAYDIIKASSKSPIGISKNTVKFVGEIFPGHIFAKIADYWFMDYGAKHFEKVDFQGLSYYCRMPFRPFPITEIDQPGKLKSLGRRHDGMWEYRPSEFYHIIKRFWNKNHLPIYITESGVCTADDQVRIQAIQEYAYWIKKAMDEGVDVRGLFHWSTFDNHEWNLGLSFRFGLMRVDFETGERMMTAAAEYYGQLARTQELEVDEKEIEKWA